ncbi:uncharacterized protein TNCV_4099531 [Trichonephila clavipes]|nr:uncharacterized protein TNCV_4099531 [Trichonephila clavipes]
MADYEQLLQSSDIYSVHHRKQVSFLVRRHIGSYQSPQGDEWGKIIGLREGGQGCGSPVVKVSNHGRHVMSSIPVPLKTRRVGQRCTLNLSRAETSSRWSSCAAEQFHGDTSLEAVDRRAPNNSKNWQGSPSRQTINGCVCNAFMSTEPSKLIGTKLSFQMNHASICETMMAAFVLNAMPVNAAFQRALSKGIVA